MLARDLRIPLPAVTAVDVPRRHLGKTTGHRLLRVAWTEADGGADRAAWRVADLDDWLAALGGVRDAP